MNVMTWRDLQMHVQGLWGGQFDWISQFDWLPRDPPYLFWNLTGFELVDGLIWFETVYINRLTDVIFVIFQNVCNSVKSIG